MVFEEHRLRLKKTYANSKIRRGAKVVILAVVVSTVFLVDTVPMYLSTDGKILYLLALAMVSLEIVETKLYDIEEKMDSEMPSRIFRNTREAYSVMANSMESLEGGRIYLVHYLGSSLSTRNALERAKDNDLEVYLLLKHPSTVDDSSMIPDTDDEIRGQVRTFIEQIVPSYFSEYDGLHVRFYRYQASLNAIKIGNRTLGVGWYTFHDENGQPRKVNDDLNPTIVYDDDSLQYDVVDEWFVDVFTELWSDAETLQDMYRNDDPAYLHEWVDRDASRRSALVERMSSDHPETKTELFPAY